MSTKAEWVGGSRFGVGVRVLTDSVLLRQIHEEIASNVMQLEEIAQLENVTTEQLLCLLRDRADADGVGARMRSFARSRPGYRVAAWRTSRHHASKLHLIDEEGLALCGTLVGESEIGVDTGPCGTCVSRAGVVVRHREEDSRDRRARREVQHVWVERTHVGRQTWFRSQL